MSLKLFNTLGRKKQEFKPIKRGQVLMYTCGPTVYQYAHIGNLRAYLAADVLRRVLEYDGYKVKQIINITDVGHLTSDADTGEDKVEAAAKRAGKTAKEITKFYADQFVYDLKALNVEMPAKFAWVSKYIREQIDLIKRLEKKGYTYKTSDGIYFDTAKFKGYGKLAPLRQGFGGSSSRARVVHSKEKKRETDFALWKFSGREKRQQEWKSPWGVGFPGWHIECSATSTAELGQPFDIHTGGEDHIAIHHNDEIAQSEAAYGKPLARYWVHHAFIFFNISMPTLIGNIHVCPSCGHENRVPSNRGYIPMEMEDGTISLKVLCRKCRREFHSGIRVAKMSKSKGGFITLADLEENGFEPLAFRYLAISGQYRNKLNFSKSALIGARNSLNKLRAVFNEKTKGGKVNQIYKKKFLLVINDDLNLPKAFTVVWELLKSKKSLADKQATLLDFDRVLGLGLKDYRPTTIPAEVKKFAQERERARKGGDWKRADKLRQEITKRGFEIKDTPTGWHITKR
ncbi:MAG: class I tRNA ligase family protein [bacterium]